MPVIEGERIGDAYKGKVSARTGRLGASIAIEHRGEGFTGVLACVDNSPQATEVLAWATAIARGLNASLRALHVLDPSTDHAAPQDPIAWDLERQQAKRRLEGLLDQTGSCAPGGAECEIAVGRFHESLQAALAGSTADLCVIGSVGESSDPEQSIGDTARRVVATARCSVLIVPPRTAAGSGQGAPEIRRLMVPLDCSRRAETALPAAIALADAFGSEIFLAHAVPEPAVTEIGPPEEAEVTLRSRCAAHNRQAAERYMSRLRGRMSLDRRPIRTLIASGADPRHRLQGIAADEKVDLIVLAAKGAGGYADQALGSVAEFLVTHLRNPILIVRPGFDRKPSNLATAVDFAAGRDPSSGTA